MRTNTQQETLSSRNSQMVSLREHFSSAVIAFLALRCFCRFLPSQEMCKRERQIYVAPLCTHLTRIFRLLAAHHVTAVIQSPAVMNEPWRLFLLPETLKVAFEDVSVRTNECASLVLASLIFPHQTLAGSQAQVKPSTISCSGYQIAPGTSTYAFSHGASTTRERLTSYFPEFSSLFKCLRLRRQLIAHIPYETSQMFPSFSKLFSVL